MLRKNIDFMNFVKRLLFMIIFHYWSIKIENNYIKKSIIIP